MVVIENYKKIFIDSSEGVVISLDKQETNGEASLNDERLAMMMR